MLLKRLAAFFLDILQVVVFAVAIFLFVYLLVLQPHKIRGESMMPNFQDGEYLLTDKVTYRFNEPKRGDVIVFKAPVGNEEDFIKRIIGLPGESVSVHDNHVYVDNHLLDESYIDPSVPTSAGRFLPEGESVVVPAGQYFVLGDNRPHSSDSRTWGFVTMDRINGRAWLVYWPLSVSGIVEAVDYN